MQTRIKFMARTSKGSRKTKHTAFASEEHSENTVNLLHDFEPDEDKSHIDLLLRAVFFFFIYHTRVYLFY